ncbi:uncharacterized protein LOC124493126 [Dermatophagoides farinae]|uniref:uncharacterized protein LOC124493126 n=1 Tax=Dermatophagoides farinae TaxID=6954 RepID=UPI003F5E3CE9
MPFISNNNDNSTIKSSPRNFPQGSYRSYKSFLNQYSNKQQQQQQQQEPQSPRRVSMPIEQSSSSKSTMKNNLSVKNRIFQFDQQQQQHQEQKRSYSVPNEQQQQQQQQQQMKNIFDIEKLLSMSSNEIEMLDKDVLERFLRLLMSEEQKSTNSSLPIKNEIDVNNNHHHMVDNNNDMNMNKTDEDIDKCKMNLIQSLKQQLERYRQK